VEYVTLAKKIAADFQHLNMAIEREVSTAGTFASVETAARLLLQVRDARDVLDRTMKMLDSHHRLLKEVHVPEAFEARGVQNISLDGYRFSRVQNWRASYREGMKPEALVWLRSNELGDIIQDFVPPMTLAATAKSLNEENQSLPDDLFSTHIQQNMSITKVIKAK
jgi:hypothetical protein